jgi:putative peptidoglycan lipid II flippase
MLFVGIGLSVTGYVGVHALLKSDELDIFLGMVKRKLGRFANRFGGA